MSEKRILEGYLDASNHANALAKLQQFQKKVEGPGRSWPSKLFFSNELEFGISFFENGESNDSKEGKGPP